MPAGEALPRQQIAERDEVDVVVGVHVADDDRVELARIADPHQLADDALAAVDQDAGRCGLDEESRTRASPAAGWDVPLPTTVRRHGSDRTDSASRGWCARRAAIASSRNRDGGLSSGRHAR